MTRDLVTIDIYRPWQQKVAFLDSAPWMGEGVCHGCENPDVFFPDKDSSRAELREAKAICNSCPVKQTCADYAIARPHLTGIWGGLTSGERAAARRRVSMRGRP